MVRSSKEDALDEEQRRKLFDACEKNKETFVCKVLCYTGLRASEFTHMKNSWLDWQQESIHIPREDGDWTPKTQHAVREIPLMFEAKKLLYNHFQLRNEIDMSRTTVYRIVRRAGRRVEGPFPKVYPHSLRATFASMLAANGLSAIDIQSIMGWAKIETANKYVRAIQTKQNFNEKMKGVQ
ncbi:MAG: tyrosine-type recombinase/integrase [Promethearchaeia archaeon]